MEGRKRTGSWEKEGRGRGKNVEGRSEEELIGWRRREVGEGKVIEEWKRYREREERGRKGQDGR